MAEVPEVQTGNKIVVYLVNPTCNNEIIRFNISFDDSKKKVRRIFIKSQRHLYNRIPSESLTNTHS